MVDRLNLIPGCGVGPLSSRPVPASGLRFWVDEATSRISVNMGTVWAEIAPIGGATPTSVAVAGTASEGTSPRAARADHTHPLPLATLYQPGAMSPADRELLNYATSTPNPNRVAKFDENKRLRSEPPEGGVANHVVTYGYLVANYFSRGQWIDLVPGTGWNVLEPLQYRQAGPDHFEIRGVIYWNTTRPTGVMFSFPSGMFGVGATYNHVVSTDEVNSATGVVTKVIVLYTHYASGQWTREVSNGANSNIPLKYVHLNGVKIRRSL